MDDLNSTFKKLSIKEQLVKKRENKLINKDTKDSLDENKNPKKPYLRTEIVYLTKEQEKEVIKDIQFSQNIQVYSKEIEFYFYNSEQVRDFGWGSGLRNTQTVLKTYYNQLRKTLEIDQNKDEKWEKLFQKLQNFDFRFENIFLSYGSQQTLLEIYQKTKNIENERLQSIFKDSTFGPFETQNGWFEPFTSYLVFTDLGIKSKLYLINGYPRNSFLPEEVFENNIIDFHSFKAKLVNHFSLANAAPVIIDDTVVSLTILGVGFKHESYFCLMIGDPYIKIEEVGVEGLYEVVLDEDGNYNENYISEFYKNTKKIQFKKKFWMMLITEGYNPIQI